MALMKIRHDCQKLFGRIWRRGDVIESREFPADQYKWAQLIDARVLDLVDKPGVPLEVGEASRDDIVKALTEVPVAVPDPVPTRPVDPGSTERRDGPRPEGRRICADCDFVAKSPHGLKVHAGRSHKKE